MPPVNGTYTAALAIPARMRHTISAVIELPVAKPDVVIAVSRMPRPMMPRLPIRSDAIPQGICASA